MVIEAMLSIKKVEFEDKEYMDIDSFADCYFYKWVYEISAIVEGKKAGFIKLAQKKSYPFNHMHQHVLDLEVNEIYYQPKVDELLLEQAAKYAKTQGYQSLLWFASKNSRKFFRAKELAKKYPIAFVRECSCTTSCKYDGVCCGWYQIHWNTRDT